MIFNQGTITDDTLEPIFLFYLLKSTAYHFWNFSMRISNSVWFYTFIFTGYQSTRIFTVKLFSPFPMFYNLAFKRPRWCIMHSLELGYPWIWFYIVRFKGKTNIEQMFRFHPPLNPNLQINLSLLFIFALKTHMVIKVSFF